MPAATRTVRPMHERVASRPTHVRARSAKEVDPQIQGGRHTRTLAATRRWNIETRVASNRYRVVSLSAPDDLQNQRAVNISSGLGILRYPHYRRTEPDLICLVTAPRCTSSSRRTEINLRREHRNDLLFSAPFPVPGYTSLSTRQNHPCVAALSSPCSQHRNVSIALSALDTTLTTSDSTDRLP